MNDENELKSISLISDLMVQVTAIQKILLDKNIVTQEELTHEINSISIVLARTMLENMNVTGNIDEIIDDLMGKRSEKLDQ